MGAAPRQLGLRGSFNDSGDPWLSSVEEEGEGEGEGERGDMKGGSLGRDVRELPGRYRNIKVRTYMALGEAAEPGGEVDTKYDSAS